MRSEHKEGKQTLYNYRALQAIVLHCDIVWLWMNTNRNVGIIVLAATLLYDYTSLQSIVLYCDILGCEWKLTELLKLWCLLLLCCITIHHNQLYSYSSFHGSEWEYDRSKEKLFLIGTLRQYLQNIINRACVESSELDASKSFWWWLYSQQPVISIITGNCGNYSFSSTPWSVVLDSSIRRFYTEWNVGRHSLSIRVI